MDATSALLSSLGIAVVVLVVMYTTPLGIRYRRWVQYRYFRRVWQSGRAVVNLRVVDGTQDGLKGSRWYGGVALASPGQLEFTMYVGGLVPAKRPIPLIEVLAVGAPVPARGIDKVKLMDPDYQIARLRTPTATLDIAVAPPLPSEDVLSRLRTPEMPQI